LFILKTDVEKFTSTNKKTLHLIFKNSRSQHDVGCRPLLSADSHESEGRHITNFASAGPKLWNSLTDIDR